MRDDPEAARIGGTIGTIAEIEISYKGRLGLKGDTGLNACVTPEARIGFAVSYYRDYHRNRNPSQTHK